MKPGAGAARRLLEGLVLTMAGAVASLGVTSGCLIRNLIRFPEEYAHNFPGAAPSEPYGHMPGTGLADMSLTVLFAVLMFAWVWALVRFLRREPRSPTNWAMGIVAAGVFVWLAWGAWRFAYPVCNSF